MRVGGTIPNIVNLTTDLSVSGSVCSVPKCFTQVYFARMDLCLADVNGNVVVCLETSMDGVKWTPHSACSAFKLDEELTNIKIGDLDGLLYRICIKADEDCHTATQGTLTASLLLKDR